MRLVIRPVQEPSREVDLTHRLTAAIADELWRLYGGNDQLNWLEAEMHLGRIVESVRLQVGREVTEEAREAGRPEARRARDAELDRLFLMVTRMDGSAAADGDASNGHRRSIEDDVPREKRRDKTGIEVRRVRRGTLRCGNGERGVPQAGAQ